MLKSNDDDWEKPTEPRDAYERLMRSAQRRERPDDVEQRYGRRGRPMTAAEFAEFRRKGRKMNYGEDRASKQELNDCRHHDRQSRNTNLMQIAVDVVVSWDPTERLENQRKVVRAILAKPRNRLRHDLEGLRPRARRRQQAIRIVRGVVFDGLSVAEYCRRNGIDQADASRMLEVLFAEEFDLRDTLNSISICNTFIIWQKRQAKRKLRNKRERKAKVLYGHDYTDVVDAGEWLADYDAGSIKSIVGGRFKPCALISSVLDPRGVEESPPLDLHDPIKWFDCATYYKWALTRPFWDAFVEPVCPVVRYEPLPDRYRSISRTVRLKGGRQKVWRISRTLNDARPLHDPIPDDILAAWLSWASQVKVFDHPYLPARRRHGIFHCRLMIDAPVHVVFMAGDLPAWATLDIKTRDMPAGMHENKLHSGGVSFIFRGLPVADCNGVAPPSMKQDWEKIESRLAEARWSDGPMCNPTRRFDVSPPYEDPASLRDPRGNPIPIKVSPNRLKPFTQLGAICWIGPLRRATAKDWAEWKSNKPKDYADFFAGRVNPLSNGDNNDA